MDMTGDITEQDKASWKIDRVPLVGQMLTPVKTGEAVERRCSRDAEYWILEDGEAAVVAERDDNRLSSTYRFVRLRNSSGLTSEWLDPENFYNDMGGKALKGEPVGMKSRYSHKPVEGELTKGKLNKKPREVTEEEKVPKLAAHLGESKSRQPYVGSILVFKSDEEAILRGPSGQEWEVETRDALMVVEVDAGQNRDQFRVRTPDGGLSDLLRTDQFEFFDGGKLLKPNEAPTPRAKKQKPRKEHKEEDPEHSPRNAKAKPRGAQLGERVVFKGSGHEPDPHWHLGFGENAVVVDIDQWGQFKLRNGEGDVSDYQDPTVYRFALGGDCLKEKVSSTAHQPKYYGGVEERKKKREIKTTVKHDDDVPPPKVPKAATSRSRVCKIGDVVKQAAQGAGEFRRQDGVGTIWTDESSELLVVAVCSQTGKIKLRTTCGQVTDFLSPNAFRFTENSSPVCLEHGQTEADVAPKPIECGHYKPRPPQTLHVPVLVAEPAKPEPAAMGSPVSGDKVDAWQRKAAVSHQPASGATGWDSEEELPSKKAPPGGWAAGVKAPEPAAATKSRDLDFGAVETPAASADEKEFIVTRKGGKVGIVAAKTTTIKVSPASAAADAGLEAGMVVKSIDGVVVKDGAELMAALRAGGEKITLVVSTKPASKKAVGSPPPPSSKPKVASPSPAKGKAPKSTPPGSRRPSKNLTPAIGSIDPASPPPKIVGKPATGRSAAKPAAKPGAKAAKPSAKKPAAKK